MSAYNGQERERIGNAIQQLMDESKLTDVEVAKTYAELTGLSIETAQTSISRYRRGETGASCVVLYNLEEAIWLARRNRGDDVPKEAHHGTVYELARFVDPLDPEQLIQAVMNYSLLSDDWSHAVVVAIREGIVRTAATRPGDQPEKDRGKSRRALPRQKAARRRT